MNLETSKNLGGIGAILLVIGLVGIIGTGYSGMLSLIGLVLVLIAMKGLSDYYKDAGIFNNTLYGFVTSIIAVVAFVAVIVVALLETIANLGIADWTNTAEWAAAFQANLSDMSAFFTLILDYNPDRRHCYLDCHNTACCRLLLDQASDYTRNAVNVATDLRIKSPISLFFIR